MKKIMRANIYFQLPDGFEGTFEEAMQMFLDFMLYADRELPPETPDENFNISPAGFKQALKYGYVALADTGVYQLPTDRPWEVVGGTPHCARIRGTGWLK